MAKETKPKVLAKVVQFYAGLDLMGSKMSSSSRDAEIEVTPIGVKIISKKSKRTILIPWSNVKGCELFPEVLEE
jgi:hypothetical protein